MANTTIYTHMTLGDRVEVGSQNEIQFRSGPHLPLVMFLPKGQEHKVAQVVDLLNQIILASQPDQIEEAAPQEPCGHIAIHTFEDGSEQCKDCLRVWPSETVEAA